MTKTPWRALLPMLLLPVATIAQSRVSTTAAAQDTSRHADSSTAFHFAVAALRAMDFVRYNRIEGLYTGIGGKISRDESTGPTFSGTVGRAWAEHTERGRVRVDQQFGDWFIGVRGERSLDITNDFRSPLDSGSLITFGSDDPHDYVDRKSAAVSVARQFVASNFLVRGEIGYADDRYVANSIKRGILLATKDYLPNHGVDAGGYRRTAFTVEWNSKVDLKPSLSGISSQLLYERGDGTLTFQRAEIHALARSHIGAVRWLSRGAFGQTFGRDILPQQLFELGQGQNLAGYENKEFAGSSAAILRTNFLYDFKFLNQSIHVSKHFSLPNVSPGFSVGLQSGWADASSVQARAAVSRLGASYFASNDSATNSRPTNHIRSTISAGLRFFSGVAYVGFARAIDRPGPWKFQLAFEPVI